MLIEQYNEFCFWYDTKREKPFKAVKFTFNYESSKEDKSIIDEIIEKWYQLSKRVNKWAANNTTGRRSDTRLIINATAWLLAEWAWLRFLKNNWIEATWTPFHEAKNQIDLKLINSNKTIEVRSSFPRNWISFAICHPKFQFGVIWPYSNNYKIWEIKKDFYVTTLFPFDTLLFNEKIKHNNFVFYLVGWATYEMMQTKWIEKDLIPEWGLVYWERAKYLIIPYNSSLDAYGIMEEMKKQNC